GRAPAPCPRHARRGAGAGDVRPHRRLLRPDELRHDGGAAPPLARAGGGPRRGRPGRPGARRRHGHRRPGDRARPPRRAGRHRRRLGLLGGHARPRPPQGPGRVVGVGQRDGAALRRRRVRRRHGRLRGPQLLRPRPRRERDGARGGAGRPRGHPRDHDAAEAAAVDLLLAVVRPGRPAGGQGRRRPRRLRVPAELRQALPRPGGRRRVDGARRAARHPLDPHRGRDHRPPRRDRRL
ncbi:MAG: Demethylmenaquinone methyltransferase, partial [uncultured Solirubrobacteraceae bacterium]